MRYIETDFAIDRSEDGNKIFVDSKGHVQPPQNVLPKGWRDKKGKPVTNEGMPPSYILKPGPDHLVVDCDDLDTTYTISKYLIGIDNAYVVKSDKEEKHFYFKKSDYYRASKLDKDTRLAIVKDSMGIKLDILQGTGSLVFPPSEYNNTKFLVQGDITDIPDIPDDLVDFLVMATNRQVLEQKGDYEGDFVFRGPLIESAISAYLYDRDWKKLQPLFEQITPSRFRGVTGPDWHPDRVPDGQGIDYLQALNFKLIGDASISEELHTKLVHLIAFDLWSNPASREDIDAHLSNLTTQSKDGKQRWRYDPDYSTVPLVSINGGAYTPICRTPDDNYLVIKPDGTTLKYQGINKLKTALNSKNYMAQLNKQTIPKVGKEHMNAFIENMDTVEELVDERMPPHLNVAPDGHKVFNHFRPTFLHNVIKGYDSIQDVTGARHEHPTIYKILRNLTADHGEEQSEKLINMFEQFLSIKFKTAEHSELIFVFSGNKGTGKDVFIDLVLAKIAPVSKTDFNLSNSHFNAQMENSHFVKHSETQVRADSMAKLKDLSGSGILRVEKKGVDAFNKHNAVTALVTSNSSKSIKEGKDDRRVVNFLSFTAKRLEIVGDLERIIEGELSSWCTHLNKIEVTNPRVYRNANLYRDEVVDAAFEVTSTGNEMVSVLTDLGEFRASYTYEEIGNKLKEALGNDVYFRISTYKGKNVIRVPLYKRDTIIKKTNTYINTPITPTEFADAGLNTYFHTGKATVLKIYDKTVTEFMVELTQEQYNQYKSIDHPNIEPIDLS